MRTWSSARSGVASRRRCLRIMQRASSLLFLSNPVMGCYQAEKVVYKRSQLQEMPAKVWSLPSARGHGVLVSPNAWLHGRLSCKSGIRREVEAWQGGLARGRWNAYTAAQSAG